MDHKTLKKTYNKNRLSQLAYDVWQDAREESGLSRLEWYWVTKDKRKIKVRDLTDDNIKNIFNFCRNTGYTVEMLERVAVRKNGGFRDSILGVIHEAVRRKIDYKTILEKGLPDESELSDYE